MAIHTQLKDLTRIPNFKNIYKGAESAEYSETQSKVNTSDRWFELFTTNQKNRKLTIEEYKEFIELSNELALEEL